MAGTLVDFIWNFTETKAYYNSSNLAFLAYILDMINEKATLVDFTLGKP